MNDAIRRAGDGLLAELIKTPAKALTPLLGGLVDVVAADTEEELREGYRGVLESAFTALLGGAPPSSNGTPREPFWAAHRGEPPAEESPRRTETARGDKNAMSGPDPAILPVGKRIAGLLGDGTQQGGTDGRNGNER